MPSLTSLNLSIGVLGYTVFVADTVLYAVTLTFDLGPKHLQCIACNVLKLYQIWVQSSNPRRSYCDL